MPVTIDAVRLAESQLDDAGTVLARAFWDDPLFTYTFPDEEERGRALPPLMRASARLGYPFGEVYTSAATVEGAAVWLPPDWGTFTPEHLERAGINAANALMSEGASARFGTAIGTFGEVHARDMPGPHWYLMILGVDPPRQGMGIGGQLIGPILERADAADLPCYLETLKARNVPFYRKHGFEVVFEGDLPDGPHYWTMRREAEK